MANIVDSGERREFESGAVRDVAEGKGRCDLLPLDICADVLAYYFENYDSMKLSRDVLNPVADFVQDHDVNHLYLALGRFGIHYEWDVPTMLIEVSKHFEDGARKYGERNWEKGIPAHCYIDSAVRHYLKFCNDQDDERHDRAFCWNLLCLAWTLKHRPECNDLWGDPGGDGR